jgi:hypothetical protein
MRSAERLSASHERLCCAAVGQMRGCQKASSPIFLGEWRLSEDKKSTRISLDISPLFFHVVPKLVQALVTTYDDFTSSGRRRNDVLLPKPLLDLGHHRSAPTRPPRTFTCLANCKNIPEVGDFYRTTPSKPRAINDFGSWTSSCTVRVWKISSYVMGVPE